MRTLTEFRELRIWLVLPILLCASSSTLFSQSGASSQTNQRQLGAQEPFRTAQASRVDRDPKTDGTLDDPLWQQAMPITNFLQHESPTRGRPQLNRRKPRSCQPSSVLRKPFRHQVHILLATVR